MQRTLVQLLGQYGGRCLWLDFDKLCQTARMLKSHRPQQPAQAGEPSSLFISRHDDLHSHPVASLHRKLLLHMVQNGLNSLSVPRLQRPR
ncbi:hypothetical protein D3C76_1581970 [compost metagenome]